MKDGLLRWYGYVQRMERIINKCYASEISRNGRMETGRSVISWKNMVIYYLSGKCVLKEEEWNGWMKFYICDPVLLRWKACRARTDWIRKKKFFFGPLIFHVVAVSGLLIWIWAHLKTVLQWQLIGLDASIMEKSVNIFWRVPEFHGFLQAVTKLG